MVEFHCVGEAHRHPDAAWDGGYYDVAAVSVGARNMARRSVGGDFNIRIGPCDKVENRRRQRQPRFRGEVRETRNLAGTRASERLPEPQRTEFRSVHPVADSVLAGILAIPAVVHRGQKLRPCPTSAGVGRQVPSRPPRPYDDVVDGYVRHDFVFRCRRLQLDPRRRGLEPRRCIRDILAHDFAVVRAIPVPPQTLGVQGIAKNNRVGVVRRLVYQSIPFV